MAKDPAFLFYPNDYLGGTMGMTFEEKGAYMELLCLQFNRGHMTSHMIGHTVGQLWDNIKDKFIIDEHGKYYNVRLDEEKLKRLKYSESRRNNLSGKNQYSKTSKKTDFINGHMTSHMENKNENENTFNINKGEILIFDHLDLTKSVDRTQMNDEQKRDRMNAIYNELKNSEIWLEDMQRINKANASDTWHYIKDFLDSLKASDDFYKSISEIKKHCVARLRKFKPELTSN